MALSDELKKSIIHLSDISPRLKYLGDKISDVLNAVKNISFDKSDLAKDNTLNEVKSIVEDINIPTIDEIQNGVAKQGDNPDATNTEIDRKLSELSTKVGEYGDGESVKQDLGDVASVLEELEHGGIPVVAQPATSE